MCVSLDFHRSPKSTVEEKHISFLSPKNDFSTREQSWN